MPFLKYSHSAVDRAQEAQRKEQARLRKLIEDANYTVTWFPNGEFYMAFRANRGVTAERKSLYGIAVELQLI